MEEKWLVYVHWIELNGVIKRYIGITHHQNPEKRWQKGNGYKPHGKYTKSGKSRKPNDSRFYNAILKYGWDNFTHEILFKNLTQNEADEKEKELILQYQSYKEEFGFNQDMGGRSNGKHSEETRRKIKDHHADVSGLNNYWCRGAIIQLTLNREYVTEYPTVMEAAKITGLNADPIRSNAAHNICSCGGYLWYWKDEYEKLDKNSIYYKPDNKRPVIQVDDEGNELAEFETCKEASIAVGRPPRSSGICHAIKKGQKFKGFYWKYKHEKYNNVQNKLDRWSKSSKKED